MRRSAPNKKPIIITIAAAALLLVLVLIGAGASRANFFENTLGSVLAPVQSAATSVSNAVGGFFRNIFNTTDADAENAKLKSELALKNRSLVEMEELRKENERLRELLGFAESAGIENGVTARVIGRPSGVYFRMFTLGAGSSSGVDINMPVVCAEGLVGIVTEVGSNWCKVTAVVDSTVAVPVIVERTRDTCIAHGVLNPSGNENRMELHYLPADRRDLVPGDVLITSGIGGVYPKGIRLGTVTEVMTGENSSIDAYIAPSVDFAHIEELLIVTGGGGNG
ncbi:MAG: rod shape-determining protein MreC [Clostridia bacterium]|nr:rod shape-determining protein MreC [Clostridia bacterium]